MRKEGFYHHLSIGVADSLREYVEALGDAPCRGLYKTTIDVVEREMLAFALQHCAGNSCETAKMLGISRTTLNKKMRAHGLKRQDVKNWEIESAD